MYLMHPMKIDFSIRSWNLLLAPAAATVTVTVTVEAVNRLATDNALI